MLVLSRQRDESIIIGDNIVITVVDIRGDKVRLGIEARPRFRFIVRKFEAISARTPIGRRTKTQKPKGRKTGTIVKSSR
jgi:carbon storage regulator CsrA